MVLKIVKKAEATLKQKIVINVLGILCALLTAALFLALGGFNPLDIYISMVNGAFGSNYRISQTVIYAVPLIILSLGIAIAFRMKFTIAFMAAFSDDSPILYNHTSHHRVW